MRRRLRSRETYLIGRLKVKTPPAALTVQHLLWSVWQPAAREGQGDAVRERKCNLFLYLPQIWRCFSSHQNVFHTTTQCTFLNLLLVTQVHCCRFSSHAACELPVTSSASEELLKSKRICVTEDTSTCVHPPRGCNAYLLTCTVVFEMKRKRPVAVMETWPVRADGLLPVEEKKEAFRSYGALSITNCQALSSGEVAEEVFYSFFSYLTLQWNRNRIALRST